MTDAEGPIRYQGTETQYLRGLAAAAFLLALFLGMAASVVTGKLFDAMAVAIVVAVGVLWRKVLAPKTWVEIRGTHYLLKVGHGNVQDVDLREATDIEWRFVPFQGSWLKVLGARGVLIELPVSRARRRELRAIGEVLSECIPGRVFADRRAARALGMN